MIFDEVHYFGLGESDDRDIYDVIDEAVEFFYPDWFLVQTLYQLVFHQLIDTFRDISVITFLVCYVSQMVDVRNN